MANRHLISSTLWDQSFSRLSKNAKITYFYVLSAPTRTSEGLYWMPIAYAAADTGLSKTAVVTALRELEEAAYLEYDLEREIVLDRRALRFNPLRGADKRIPAAVRKLSGVAESPLFVRFVGLAETYSPDLAVAIWDAHPSFITAKLQAPREELGRSIDGPE